MANDPVEDIIYIQDINQKVDYLNIISFNILHDITPVRCMNLKPEWFTFNLRKMNKEKDRAHSKFLKSKTAQNWTNFKQIRNATRTKEA